MIIKNQTRKTMKTRSNHMPTQEEKELLDSMRDPQHTKRERSTAAEKAASRTSLTKTQVLKRWNQQNKKEQQEQGSTPQTPEPQPAPPLDVHIFPLENFEATIDEKQITIFLKQKP